MTAYPFQGDKLFGDSLDKILVETRDTKKAMPRSLRRGEGQVAIQLPRLQDTAYVASLLPRVQETILGLRLAAISETWIQLPTSAIQPPIDRDRDSGAPKA